MNKVLVLGAGLVARPLVRYLLDVPELHVTIASRTRSKADALAAGHARATTMTLLADDNEKLARLIAEHDLAVSLLPATLHPTVAQMCVQHGKQMVTTSYISPAMRELDRPAQQAGVILLNEIGVDPGIDHMSAMKIIDDVRQRGGRVSSFRSSCGGLPAPEANDNPFGYKISWSPRAVCTAGKNPARFRQDGKQVDVPGPELFGCYRTVHADGVGQLEDYPNRDSLGYIEMYGLEGIDTMYRGTLRYPGWCDTLKKMVDVGLLDETPVTYPAGTSHAQFTAQLLSARPTGDVRKDLAAEMGIEATSPILDRLEWLGLFGDEPIPTAGTETTPMDVLAGLLGEKLWYAPGERDMIVLRHEFVARFEDRPDENITSTLLAFGEPDGDSAMSRTVSLPAAIAAKLILQERIKVRGLQAPVIPEIYNPVLAELAALGIRMEDRIEQDSK